MNPQLYNVLDRVADSFNPLLALAALAAPLFRRPFVRRHAIAYYLCGGLAVVMVYAIRALDARYELWARASLDFSTHTAFAASLASSLAWFNRRWLVPVLVALALYVSLVLIMRYHNALDVASSSLLAATITVLVHAIGNRTRMPAGRKEPVA